MVGPAEGPGVLQLRALPVPMRAVAPGNNCLSNQSRTNVPSDYDDYRDRPEPAPRSLSNETKFFALVAAFVVVVAATVVALKGILGPDN